MSSHFSANQYEDAFDSKRLQNWQLPQTYKERPSPYDGFTQIIANDRGHLLEGVPRSKESPWGNFVGTWDMPKQIPGNVTTSMARSKSAVKEIKRSKQEHEAFMKQAAGSPTKETFIEKASSPVKSPEPRPGNPSPHSSQEQPPSKSPIRETPGKTSSPHSSQEAPSKSPIQETPRTPRPSPADADEPANEPTVRQKSPLVASLAENSVS